MRTGHFISQRVLRQRADDWRFNTVGELLKKKARFWQLIPWLNHIKPIAVQNVSLRRKKMIFYAMIHGRRGAAVALAKATWTERARATFFALPTVVLAIAIIGSIYAGIATPSESAGVGFVLAIIITFSMGRMNWAKLKEAIDDSLRTTAMIFIIIAGAKVFPTSSPST